MRKLVVLAATFAALILAPSAASAAPPTSIFGGDINCGVVTTEGNVDGSLGQTWCGSVSLGDGTTSVTTPAITTQVAPPVTDPPTPAVPVRSTSKTFDGVPLDVNFALPNEADFGSGPYPVVGMYHGYGGSKINFKSMQHWLQKGYATFSLTNRGSGESCKSAQSIAADPTGCADGYVHLMDPRYEIRDAQDFLGQLVDQGLVAPTKIAATGGSYGGAESIDFAILKDRVQNQDGTFSPWESPLGTPMSTAVATPQIPWTDLEQSLAPNGDTLDYLKDGSFQGKVGIMKESFVNGLYISARNAPAGTDPDADVAGWKNVLDAGEPYTGAGADEMLQQITQHHSPYYLDHSQAPAPLLISNGFTDDLFPVDENLRFYNRTRAEYPNTPMALLNGSFGHMRGQSQANVSAALEAAQDKWVDYYLDGTGSQPASDVTAYTQTCPAGTNGGGPYHANDWASIAPGEIRDVDAGGDQTIAANGGVAAPAAAFNPILGQGACASPPNAKEAGTANYDLAAAPAGGYTVLGAATVLAKFSGGGANSEIAARLVDVNSSGTETLISRGTWRPDDSSSDFQVFQLHPGAWRVEPGHVVRLELLPRDAIGAAGAAGGYGNYGRPSNLQQAITVNKLELRVPVTESPGALGGLITAPAAKVLPARAGAELAPGYEAIGSTSMADYTASRADAAVCPTGQTGTPPNCVTPPNPIVGKLSLNAKPTIKGKTMTVKVICKIGYTSCSKTSFSFKGAPKGKSKKGKGLLVAKGSAPAAKSGGTRKVTFKLTGKARKFFKDKKIRKHGKKKVKKGPKSLRASVKVGGKSAGTTTIKRVGRVK